MELNNDNFKSHLFISTTAWIFIILTSIALYFSITNLIVLKIGTQSQHEFIQTMTDDTDEIMIKLQSIWQSMSLFLLVGTLSSFALLIAAINLLKRKNWARILFTTVCILVAGLFIAFGFYLKYQYGETRNLLNLNLDEDISFLRMQLAYQIQLVAYLIFLVGIAWSMVRVLIKLNSREVRAVFQ